MKRLLLYNLQDIRGVVSKHAADILNAFGSYCDYIVMLCDKFPDAFACRNLQCNKYIKTKGQVGNLYAFIEGCKTLGWKELLKYDEVLYICDDIYMLSQNINERLCCLDTIYIDFWGLVECYHEDNIENKYIENNFIAIRKNVLSSIAFQIWIESYNGKEEKGTLSDCLQNFGYKYLTWINLAGTDKNYNQPMIQIPDKLVLNYKLPFFSINAFATNYVDIVKYSDSKGCRRLYDYMQESGYDMEDVWDYMCRNYNQYDWYNCLHFNYIIPETCEYKLGNIKLALMMHLYYMDLIDISFQYACNMPETCDIYITTDCELKKRIIENKFRHINCRELKIFVVKNRGRSESAFCIGLSPYMHEYDYICFVHDKKTSQTKPESIGNDFWIKCMDNILLSKEYVGNIIKLFKENSRIGILMSLPPIHGIYYAINGVYGWGENFDNTKKLLESLHIDVLMDIAKEPIAPLGSMFWFRPDAIKALFEKQWRYEDFPEEPNQSDGTLLHAIERSYCFIAQSAGYYSAYISTNDYASEDISILKFYLSQVNKCLREKGEFNDLVSVKKLIMGVEV